MREEKWSTDLLRKINDILMLRDIPNHNIRGATL